MKSKKVKKTKSIIKRIVAVLLLPVTIVFLGASAMCFVSPFINPNTFVWASYFGLAFWPILIVNILLLLFMIWLRSKYVFITLLAVLISIPGIGKSYAYGKRHEGEGEVKVMSYNVLNFNHNTDKDLTSKDVAANIIAFIREHNPDVVCFQEFSIFDHALSRQQCVEKMCSETGLDYYYYNRHSNFRGNVIISKYPIKETGNANADKDLSFGAIKMIDMGDKGKFCISNVHFTSVQMTYSEINYISDGKNIVNESDTYGKSIISKLKKGYKNRTEDTRKLLELIPNDSTGVLVCGDFNDTPLSYTYNKMKAHGLKDGFVKAGRGVGVTFAGHLPLLRIDYIWCNASVHPVRFQRIKVNYSDHYPIIMSFNLN